MFHTIQKGSLEYLTADALEGSVHCFTTRYGGVSTGQFSTLNLGTSRGDSMENVLRNYEILGAAVGFSPEDVVHTWQEHTDTILRVGKVDCGKGLFRNQPEVCDGLITDEPGVALVCFAADCTPVLLFDPVKNVAAAVHAGWRGTANGIVRKTVEKMAREFGSNPPISARQSVLAFRSAALKRTLMCRRLCLPPSVRRQTPISKSAERNTLSTTRA